MPWSRSGAGWSCGALPESARFRIAPATLAEIDEIGALFGAYAASLTIDLGYQDFATELAGLPGNYALPRGGLLIARDEAGNAIGCVALRARGSATCEMKRLYVVPAARGLGLGKALIEAVIVAARRIGYSRMLLDTLPSMGAAQRMYRAAGFVPITPYYAGAAPGTIFLGLWLGDIIPY